MADALIVFRILADADIHLVVVDHRGREEVILRPLGAQNVYGRLGVAIKLPDNTAVLGIETVHPAVAARKDHLRFAVGLSPHGVGPLAVHDVAAWIILGPD